MTFDLHLTSMTYLHLGTYCNWLDYMVALLEDAQDFSWGVAKASHPVLLCRMEQGEIRYFSESEKIDRVRRAILKDTCHKVKVKLKIIEPNLDKNIAKPCHVSSSTRIHVESHETKGVLYRHVCSTCLEKLGKSFVHSDLDCRNKLKNSKNE